MTAQLDQCHGHFHGCSLMIFRVLLHRLQKDDVGMSAELESVVSTESSMTNKPVVVKRSCTEAMLKVGVGQRCTEAMCMMVVASAQAQGPCLQQVLEGLDGLTQLDV